MKTPNTDVRVARERDAAARRIAQTEFVQPVFLEAGAGTGKTAVLVARIVAWALGPGWERVEQELFERTRARGFKPPAPEEIAGRTLQRIVAITFTEAAAAEMAQRVSRAFDAVVRDVDGKSKEWPRSLNKEILPADSAVRSARAQALLAMLDQLVVRTIHAFCRRLLARHPLEAGLHPNFQVDADGFFARECVREVVETQLIQAYAADESSAAFQLALLGFGPDRIEKILRQLVEVGATPALLAEDPLTPDKLAYLAEQLRGAASDFLQAGGERLLAARRAKKQCKAIEALQVLVERLAREVPCDVSALEKWVAALSLAWGESGVDSYANQLNHWREGKFGKAGAECLAETRPRVRAAAERFHGVLQHILQLNLSLLNLLRRALFPLLAEVESALHTRGVQTFSALLRDARDLLRDHPHIAAEERGRIAQLLVDEFQDTDPLQCEIVEILALQGCASERPNLFVVGDPKQSIYGWRRADLRAYHDFADKLVALGAEKHVLLVNYRSLPAILEEVKHVIAPVMEERRGVQPAFQELFPDQSEQATHGDERAVIEHWVSWQWDAETREPLQETNADTVSELEARAVAAEIAELSAEGVPLCRIGLLFRTRTGLEIYLNALRDAGLPYAGESEQSYYQRREVIDAAALVRCVLDPHDHVALVAYLRSAAVGVPDAAWLPLWRHNFPEYMSELVSASEETLAPLRACVAKAVRAVPEGVPGIERVRGWELSLLDAVAAIAELRSQFHREPADRFVEILRMRTLLEATEAARYQGSFRVANLERFFRELRRTLEVSDGDVPATLRALRAGAASAGEEKEGRLVGTADDAVQILTIHKAKGLDFEHVYLLQHHRESDTRAARAVHLARCGDSFEYCLWRDQELGRAATLGYGAALASEFEREAAERVRTLYVGLTRAQRRLVVAGRWNPNATGSAGWEGAKNHADLLSQRQAGVPDLTKLMRDCAESGQKFSDVAGARWVFLGLPPQPAEGLLHTQQAKKHAACVSAAVAAAEILQTRRCQARAREARPFYAVASRDVSALAYEAAAVVLTGEERGVEIEEVTGEESIDARAAAAVGSAVHRVLEHWDFGGEPVSEANRRRALLLEVLEERLPEVEWAPALARAETLLARFTAGSLGSRFRALREHMVARELPILLKPQAEDGVVLGVVVGAIDLVYRDPENGEWVIVDYKTDAVAGAAELLERATRYRTQLQVYARALQQSLNLASAPRQELWFLAADRSELLS